MRADPNLYNTINPAIQSSESSLQSAVRQLSSGKRVSTPSDDPLAFAQNSESLSQSARVDRYTRNSDAVLSQAQVADSALSSVITGLTQAISLGTEGGNSSVSSLQKSALIEQLQGIMSSVVSQANTAVSGVALFAGTTGSSTAFVADPVTPGSFIYQGNSGTNQAQVGDSLTVTVNVPGDTIFQSPSGNVLGSLQQMIGALQTGTTVDVASANTALTAAIAHVGQIRAEYGSTVNQLNMQTGLLSQETVTLSAQQSSLTVADTAMAATTLSQAQIQYSAVLAMAAKVLPQSLLTYLH